MAIVAVSLGSSPTGAGGDTNREAFTKLNTSISELDARSVGDAVLEVVSGAAGFADVSGDVSLNLTAARAFHHRMTGDLTSLAFTNVPDADEYAASWTWALNIDGTGGYSLPPGVSLPTVVWVDGNGWADISLVAYAKNLVNFWQVGLTTYAALITNGVFALDPYVIAFPADGTALLPIARGETVALGSVTHLAAAGGAGTGTLSFTKDGAAASGNTSFAAGEVLGVTLSGGSAPSGVSIPRFAE